MHLCRIYIWYRFMLFLLGFTCMFVSLQSFLQHLIQETIWKLVKAKMSAAESFSKTWRYLPGGLMFLISFLFYEKKFLLSVCIAVAWRIPPILSWDQSLHKQYVDKFAFAYLNCILPCVFLLPSKQQWKMSIVLLVELP